MKSTKNEKSLEIITYIDTQLKSLLLIFVRAKLLQKASKTQIQNLDLDPKNPGPLKFWSLKSVDPDKAVP